MSSGFNMNCQLDDFMNTYSAGRKLDPRTEKAYRLDMKNFYIWLEGALGPNISITDIQWEKEIESYLNYLSSEKGLRPSTIFRKYRVLGYYLGYLAKKGIRSEGSLLKDSFQPAKVEPGECIMSKAEIDAFFRAMDQDYKNLDTDYRRRICLRNLVMMKLLFYYGIGISQLLLIEASDYDSGRAVLTVPGKMQKDRDVVLFSHELQEQMAAWMKERKRFVHENEYQERMFLSSVGKPLSMKMVIKTFDKYRVLAGIERECTPKDLKKSMKRYAWEVVVGEIV